MTKIHHMKITLSPDELKALKNSARDNIRHETRHLRYIVLKYLVENGYLDSGMLSASSSKLTKGVKDES